MVVNRHKCQPQIGDVYIGRPSRFGNPFVIGMDGSREDVIRKFREYISDNMDIVERLRSLKPKRLVCFCSPEACHGDVYVELLSEDSDG